MNTLFSGRQLPSLAVDEIRLADALTLLVEGKRLILILTAAMTLLGIGYAFLAPPVYRADALVQVADSTGIGNDGLAAVASMFDNKATDDAEMELIGSRLVVGSTVRDLHLDIEVKPKYFPVVGRILASHADPKTVAPAEFGLTSYAWGGERIAVSRLDVPRKLLNKKFFLIAGGEQTVSLMDDSGKEIIRGKVGQPLSGDTEYGRVFLFVQELRARAGTQFMLRRFSTNETTDKLQDLLQITEKSKDSGVITVSLDGDDGEKVANVVNAVAQRYVNQNIDRKSAEAERALQFLDGQLPALRHELDQAEDRYSQFRNKNGTVDLSEESQLLLRSIEADSATTLELRQQRAQLAGRFSPSHPAIAAVDSQLAELQRHQEQLNQRVSRLPDLEQTALRLMRDVRVDTALYMNLMNNAQELKVAKASQIGNVRIVDSAEPAESPVKPKKAVVIAVAFVFGLALGIATVVVRKSLFGGVENSQQIEDAFGIPVYAVVPRSASQLRMTTLIRSSAPGMHVLAHQFPHDIAIEGMRSLRTALQFELVGAENNVLMVTGPAPDVGKSFVSVNLAAVLAMSGMRVLLIDADLRRGDVHGYFGVSRQPGLSNVISGSDFDSAVVRNILPNLDMIPSGSIVPNPSEMLLSARLTELMARVKKEYDLVILDTPPVLAVTDSALLGPHAGTSMLVLRHGCHPVSEIRESVKRLSNSGVSLKGMLLTDVPPRRIGNGSYTNSYYSYESSSS